MILSTVLSSVNDNPDYYMFIPKQIKFWRHFNINFIAIMVSQSIPEILIEYKDNIILWTKNKDVNDIFISQNIRLYYPALLNLPDNEMIMITDMDMLPLNDNFYKKDIDKYNLEDFIYYRYIDKNQIYICYNAANPKTWANIFNINNERDIENIISSTYKNDYDGRPGFNGWFTDQEIMYNKLILYPHLKILNRPLKRLEMKTLKIYLKNKNINNLLNNDFTDAHFHRSYNKNIDLILIVEKLLFKFNE